MGLLPDYSIKDKLWLIILRRWKTALIIFSLISIVGIITTYHIKPIYQAKTKLKFKNINFNYFLENENSEATNLPPAEQGNFVSTEVEVIRALPLVEKTISRLQLKNSQGKSLTPKEFQDKLQIHQISNTDIIEISYLDPNRQIAAQVINALVTNYIDNNVTNDLQELATSKDFLDQELSKAEKNLKQIENSIANIKKDHQIFALEKFAKSLTQTLEEINKKIIINRSEIAKLKSKSQFLTSKLGMSSDEALVTVKVNQSLTVQNLSQQLQQLELELIREKNRTAIDNNKIIKIQQELQSKEESLQQQITRIAGAQEVILFENSELNIIQDLTLELVKLEANNIGLEKELKYLVEMEQETSRKVNLLPDFELKLRELNRKLNTSQSTYDVLLQDINQIQFAEKQNINNVRVISSEVIQQSSLPFSYLTAYLASVFLGLILAIIAISILEVLDRSLKTVEEAQKIFKHDWLGIIPEMTSNSLLISDDSINQDTTLPLIIQYNSDSKIYESYKIFYSNLKFLCSKYHLQTIVITSSLAKEGKSSIAANLAYTMAQKGENVLLIDGNFQAPVQNKIWDIYHNIGLSNLIKERLSAQSVIQRVMPNLDVISSGEITSITTNILDSPRMQKFLDNCAMLYDFILIDSPALDTNTDAIALGKMTDGMLLVVQSGQVSYSQAKFAKELLDKSGQNVLGLVFNQCNSRLSKDQPILRSQNKLGNNQELFSNLEHSEASLWEFVSRYPRELKFHDFLFGLNSEELNEISLAELEKSLAYLERDLEKLTQIVKEQEDEFFLQGQTVRNLQKQANLANIQERSQVEQQLLQEQELKKLLGETLLGQRRNLNQKKEILNQYRQFILSKKDSEVQLNGNND